MNLLFIGSILLGVLVAAGLGYGFVSLLQKITDKQELKKFIMLGLILSIIIAAYWVLVPLKDSFFGVIVGKGYRGLAKNISIFLISALVLLYSKLLDVFPKHHVIYILTATYGIALFIFMLFFMNPAIGPANTLSDPSRLIGWVWYAFVESIGSLVVAVFWAFTTDITQPESAKHGFSIIVLFAQIGNICGPLSIVLFSGMVGSGVPFVGIAGTLLLLAGGLVWLFLYITPPSYLLGFHSQEQEIEPGFFDGLKLLVSKTYLLCIFGIVAMFELLNTLLELYLKDEVRSLYPTEIGATLFLAKFAIVVGVIAALSLIFRIGELPRLLGILPSLILLPVLIITGFVAINIFNGFGYLVQGLFVVVAGFKAINYALNAPTCKQLYIPTSRSAKYKSQAWIETFGSRSAKAGGGLVNFAQRFIALGWQLPVFLFIAIGMVSFVWLPAIFYAARRYNKAIKDNEIIC